MKARTVAAELPLFIPSIDFFLRMAAADLFIIADNLKFSSRSRVQRTLIRIQEQEKWLTVPVHFREGDLIERIRIDYHENWPEKMTKSIHFAYHQLPFYAEFFPKIQSWLGEKYGSVSALNNFYINWVRDIWNIDTEIMLMSELFKQKPENDLALALCKKLDAARYVIDHHNRDFVHMESMRKVGIDIIDMGNYGEYLPLELENTAFSSSLELIFAHGPQMRVLFEKIKD